MTITRNDILDVIYKGFERIITDKEALNNQIKDIKKASRRKVAGMPYELDYQLLIQYGLFKD